METVLNALKTVIAVPAELFARSVQKGSTMMEEPATPTVSLLVRTVSMDNPKLVNLLAGNTILSMLLPTNVTLISLAMLIMEVLEVVQNVLRLDLP